MEGIVTVCWGSDGREYFRNLTGVNYAGAGPADPLSLTTADYADDGRVVWATHPTALCPLTLPQEPYNPTA